MSLGDEPAFPTNRAGHSPEPGMSIRDYIEVEILAKLYVEILKKDAKLNHDNTLKHATWAIEGAQIATEAWLLHREKRNGLPNRT